MGKRGKRKRRKVKTIHTNAVKNTVTKLPQKEQTYEPPKNDASIDTDKENKRSFFYDILILIVSLLHGTLFFVLAEKVVELINNFSVIKLSYLLFFFAIFLRIFQTHILAAVKYTEKWLFRPMDFIMVFLTALFEYILFNNSEILGASTEWHFYTVFAFCLFGIVGYFVTYRRTYKDYEGADRKSERLIQLINIICILAVGVLKVLSYLYIFPECINISLPNFLSAGILVLNIYLSLRLSGRQINKIIKTR